MRKPKKTYCVTFIDRRFMRIELKARSPSAAIKAAEHLYLHVDSNDDRFEHFGGEAFDAADAEEVRP